MSGRLANAGGPGLTALRSRLRDMAETHRSLTIIIAMAIVAVL
jgi:hypothetical protein